MNNKPAMFIPCAAAVPGPVQPIPNNLLCAASLFFPAAVGRPWREAAPPPPIMLNLEKTVGVQSPTCTGPQLLTLSRVASLRMQRHRVNGEAGGGETPELVGGQRREGGLVGWTAVCWDGTCGGCQAAARRVAGAARGRQAALSGRSPFPAALPGATYRGFGARRSLEAGGPGD